MFLVILLFGLFREARTYSEGLLILHRPARDKINYSFLGYARGAQGSDVNHSQFNSTLKTTVVDHKMDIESKVFLFFVLPTYFLMYLRKSGWVYCTLFGNRQADSKRKGLVCLSIR